MYKFLPLLALLFLWSCGDSNTTTDAAHDDDHAHADHDTDHDADHHSDATTITLSPMPDTKDYPGAAITEMKYQAGRFDFAYDGGADGYELGAQTPDADQLMCANSTKGQHIHLIVDTEPYAAKYEASFDYEIADGEHYILAFLSRSYHESLKHAEASRVVMATVADNGFESVKEVTEPMLFYSRPKGSYAGDDAKRVMLDFYPVNLELGDDYQVKVEVGDQSFMVDSWQPYYFEGLPVGDHTVTLTLVDSDGQTVDTPLNPVSRNITIGM